MNDLYWPFIFHFLTLELFSGLGASSCNRDSIIAVELHFGQKNFFRMALSRSKGTSSVLEASWKTMSCAVILLPAKAANEVLVERCHRSCLIHLLLHKQREFGELIYDLIDLDFEVFDVLLVNIRPF